MSWYWTWFFFINTPCAWNWTVPLTVVVKTVPGAGVEHAVAVGVLVGVAECLGVGVVVGTPVGEGVGKSWQILIASSAKPWVGVGPGHRPGMKTPVESTTPKHPLLLLQLEIMVAATSITTGARMIHLIQCDIEP